MCANNSLEGPYRPVIVNLPVALIETLDDVANEHDMDRSELIRITLRLHQEGQIVVADEDDQAINPIFDRWMRWCSSKAPL